MSDKVLTVSLKGGQQAHPWTVIDVDTVDDLLAVLRDLGVEFDADVTPLQAIAEANVQYQAVLNVTTTPAGSGEPAQVAQAATPAPARQDQAPVQGGSSYARRKASAGTGGRGGQRDNTVAPGVVPEACAHGDRSYREGVSPKGPWAAWFCASPKGTPGQCDAIWVRD